MDDDQRSVIAIAEQGSISKAAQVVHVSQPALSQRLKNLEARLGVTLFNRRESPIELTYAGQIYVRWARSAVAAEGRMMKEVEAVARKAQRRLRVGVSLPRCGKLLPEIIERFYAEVQGCNVVLVEAGTVSQLNTLLADDAIDLAVLTPARPDASVFVSEPLCPERLLYVAPSSWMLETTLASDGISCVSPAVIADHPFIMPPSEQYLSWIVRTMMDTAGYRLDVILNSCTSELTIEMIRRGMGASIAPSTFTLGEDDGSIAHYGVEGFFDEGALYFAARQGWESNGDACVFMNLLREWLSGHPLLSSR